MRVAVLLLLLLAVTAVPASSADPSTRTVPFVANAVSLGALGNAVVRDTGQPCVHADQADAAFCFAIHDGMNRFHVRIDDASGARVGGYFTWQPRSGSTFCPCIVPPDNICGEADFTYDAGQHGANGYLWFHFDKDICAQPTTGTATFAIS